MFENLWRVKTVAIVFFAVLSSALEGAPSPSTSAPFSVNNPGSDLPPLGRSYFDHFIYGQEGEASKATIPFPFEALVKKIQGSSANVTSALIPRGRSLQKEAARPTFFLYPRIVIAASPDYEKALSPSDPFAFDPTNRIFLGYVELSNRVEIISYNEAAGRYEFQIIKDYGKGLKPKLVYANRELCSSCHQGQVPIFPDLQWNETNENVNIAKLLQAGQGEQNYYHGLAIGNDAAYPQDDQRHLAFTRLLHFDRTVRNAAAARRGVDLWIYGCGGDAPDAVDCRAAFFRSIWNAIKSRMTIEKDTAKGVTLYPTNADLPELLVDESVWKVFQKNWSTFFPGGNPFPRNFLRPIPISRREAKTAQDLEAVKLWVETYVLNRELDPLTIRSPSAETSLDSWTDVVDAMIMLFQGQDIAAVMESGDRDGQKIEAAVQSLLAKTKAGESKAFAAQAPSRDSLIGGLLRELGKSPPKLCCDAPNPDFPPPALEDMVLGNPNPSDARLRQFKIYCVFCHGADVEPTFMQGTDAEILESIKSLADRIIERLDWLATSSPMPPASSQNYKILAMPEHSQDRLEMMITARKLSERTVPLPSNP